MYVDHRQNNWSEWLATAEFTFNNKVHTVMKSLPFKVNYRREPRMSFDIRKKGKNVKIEMKDRYKKVKAALIKSQEEIKRQADRSRKKAEEYRVGDKVLISTKDFLIEWMKRFTRKLMKKYIEPYVVKRIVSENVVELEFLAEIRIYPVVNVRRIVKY